MHCVGAAWLVYKAFVVLDDGHRLGAFLLLVGAVIAVAVAFVAQPRG